MLFVQQIFTRWLVKFDISGKVIFQCKSRESFLKVHSKCNLTTTCHCGKKHHVLLHGSRNILRNTERINNKQKTFKFSKSGKKETTHIIEEIDSDDESDVEDEQNQQKADILHVNSTSRKKIGLRTFPVILENPANKKKEIINALLDDGSTVTLLDDSVAVVLFNHIDYRSGAIRDMRALTAKAQQAHP